MIDRALAVAHDLAPGDPFVIAGFEFTVSGISTRSSALLTPFAFITYDDLIDFYFDSEVAADIATFPLLSFLIVETEPGADPAAVAQRIEARVQAADAYLPEVLAARDERLGREMLGPILGLLLAVSYGIGVLVVGMFMFVAVRGRWRTLGVLKALGFPSRALYSAALLEALLLAAMALPVGLLLALALGGLINALAPVYTIQAAQPLAIARSGLGTLVFAVLGALAPARAIARIDPAQAFRG